MFQKDITKQIDKETLYNLYITQNLTLTKVSELTNISKTQLKRFLKSFNIVKDTTARANNIHLSHAVHSPQNTISKEDLEDMYINQNLSMNQISKKTGVSKTSVGRLREYYNIPKKSEEKIKESNIEVTKATIREKYGVDNIMQTKEFREKAKEAIKKKYGVEYYSQLPTFKNKVNLTLSNRNGKNEEFVKIYLDDTLFTDWIHKNSGKTLQEISDIFGLGKSTIEHRVNDLSLNDNILYNPKSSSYEKEIVDILTSFGITNIKQNVTGLFDNKKQELDIYLPDYNFAIEFNGNYWHSEEHLDNKLYHQKKSLECENKGIFLYHIFEYEWVSNKELYIDQIKHILMPSDTKIYARKCHIKEVDGKTARKFLVENHIQGRIQSTYCIGLYNESDELVMLMTFGKPRFSKKQKFDWELLRLCTKTNTTIVGGASKIFKYFINKYCSNGETVVSFSNFGKTKGEIYPILGFEYDHLSYPSYVWCKDHATTLSRYQTQMKDENKIMREKGYNKIWDSGNKVWIYHVK